MRNAQRRVPPARNRVPRQGSTGTRLPSAFLRECEAAEGHTSGFEFMDSFSGKDAGPQKLSRKERRKRLRMELRQQKQEHQRLRKRLRLGHGVETNAATSQQRRRTLQKSEAFCNERGGEREAAGDSEGDTGGTSECSNNDERQEVVLETASIGAAAAALKQQQQQQLLKLQQHECDNLQHELQWLEKRLGFRRSSKKSSPQAQAKAREKLREELRRDGFDLDLQDMLEDIGASLDTFADHPGSKGESSDSEKNCTEELTASPSSVEAELSESEDREPHGHSGNAGSSAGSQVYVAPHRRRQCAHACSLSGNSVSLEAVKTEVVRALNRVSEGNAEPVLHQLLAVLNRSASELRRSQDEKNQALGEMRSYAARVRQLLCEQLMQSCIRSPFSTNSLIATQTAVCCALGKTWDIELCRDFLRALAACFSAHFSVALEKRSHHSTAVEADAASLTARHAVVGVCCLYDFGFVSSRLFVDLIRRVAGLSEGNAGVPKPGQELSDYRVELLVLLLRLGGAKLRQDDAALFAAVWKELQDFIEAHQGASGARDTEPPASGAGEPSAEAGRLRALLLELRDLKSGKQKNRLMLIKASQDVMRRWLNSSALFASHMLYPHFQIDGSWTALEKGQLPVLPSTAAAAAQIQQQQRFLAADSLSAPDASALSAAASRMQRTAALLRFNTELQRSLFECLVTAEDPDDALRRLQDAGHLLLKKNTVTQTIAVTVHCCLQERLYNAFYEKVLFRLCGVCCCKETSSARDSACTCFLSSGKAAGRYRKTVQRALAAQASAAHGFSLRRLLNLAKLFASLVRIGVTDLRLVRFLNFEDAAGAQGPMGLSGKLGVFLREVCVELLSTHPAAASPLPASADREDKIVEYFECLRPMSDICEAFLALLQDVLLPDARAGACSASGSAAAGALKCSVVKAAIAALLADPQPA